METAMAIRMETMTRAIEFFFAEDRSLLLSSIRRKAMIHHLLPFCSQVGDEPLVGLADQGGIFLRWPVDSFGIGYDLLKEGPHLIASL